MSSVRPFIQVLSPAQREQVHDYSLRILSGPGMRVDSPAAREVFIKGGCPVGDGGQVSIPADLVHWALEQAPASIEIFNRKGEPAFTLGGQPGSQTRFGIGVTNLHFQDPASGEISPFALKHVALAAGLAQHLPQYDLLSTPGIAQDLPAHKADLHATLHMLAHTTKPLLLLVSHHPSFLPVLDLLGHLSGDFFQRPFAMAYVNPISPLVLNDETSDKMAWAIERGLPVVFNNYGMSGATAPITPGGTLTLLNAELLTGLVFAQLLKAGAPIILGSLPAGFDMKNMGSLYTPHTMLLNLASAEMMAHYGLPHSGTAGSAPGWGADLLAAGGYWLNHLSSLLGKAGMAPFVGGSFDSLVFSPAAVAYAAEVIRQARIFAQGFDLDDEAVSLEEIRSTGAGGNFLMSGQTLKLFRQLPYESPIWPSYTLEQWQAKGSPSAGALLTEYVLELMESMEPPQDQGDIMERGGRFITSLKS
jgi:trimethylamine--corrinoid protein Co-methyltransferase